MFSKASRPGASYQLRPSGQRANSAFATPNRHPTATRFQLINGSNSPSSQWSINSARSAESPPPGIATSPGGRAASAGAVGSGSSHLERSSPPFHPPPREHAREHVPQLQQAPQVPHQLQVPEGISEDAGTAAAGDRLYHLASPHSTLSSSQRANPAMPEKRPNGTPPSSPAVKLRPGEREGRAERSATPPASPDAKVRTEMRQSASPASSPSLKWRPESRASASAARPGAPVSPPRLEQSQLRKTPQREYRRGIFSNSKRFIACGSSEEFHSAYTASVHTALKQQLACWAKVESAMSHLLGAPSHHDDIHVGSNGSISLGEGDADREEEVKIFLSRASTQSARMLQSITDATRKKDEASQDRTALQAENDCLAAEKAELKRQVAELTAERDRAIHECRQSSKAMTECQAECERKLAEARLEMATQTGTFFAECGRTIQANQQQWMQQFAEYRAEREKLERENAEMAANMSAFRSKMVAEEAEMQKKVEKLHEECQRKVATEKAAAERRLAEGRMQTEEQLRMERQVTDHIMHVLRELPPLQSAMELGDLRLLEEELIKWQGDVLPERFGECKGVVQAMLKLARERLVVWRGLEHTWRDVLREAERVPAGVTALPVLIQQGQRVFRVLKEAQLTKMDLRRSDQEAAESICKVLFAWQERATAHCNNVQRSIVRKVVFWPQLGPFDFADLDICLHLVDRRDSANDVFLSRAQALVEDDSTAPKEFRSLLAHLGTMLFFLKYTKSEDLQLTHAEFRRQSASGHELDSAVREYLGWAERMYQPGSELVRFPAGKDLMDMNSVATVLKELRMPPTSSGPDCVGIFREIFYQWALAMRNKFNLLVLPHHTQVVCLLAFRRFLESEVNSKTPHTLIAQVGTGEGKSMIVAALAIYVVVAMRKKVHVVVDDDTLLERDFTTFKRVFEAFELVMPGGYKRKLTSVLCLSEEKLAGREEQYDLACRVDPEADVCYCEAKHVQSFYASIARGQKRDFASYKDYVLILDEVDALVIDEEPNEVFVYPNQELSKMATAVAGLLASGAPQEDFKALRDSTNHAAAGRVVAEMTKEWAQGKRLVAGEDFVYAKETGRYFALQAGRANPKAWSLALECRNFQDGLARDILFQERLFVMSRPRVFRKYYRILGLSGSIGSVPERQFLRDTYRAAFFDVPPFLKTCRGSPFYEALPVKLGVRQRAVYVEQTQEAQIARIAEIVLEARKRVPVLLIARDRTQADRFVEKLRQMALSHGLVAGIGVDVIRSLSRTLYESDPEQWKENLNRSTLPVGEGHGGGSSSGGRCWRISVTDPRGGRGTDYRVDDQGVDANGGLLLVPTVVPTSRREWTQFLGRTARQDCRGQFCCVLCAADYQHFHKKYGQALPADGGLEVVETILGWGDKEASERIRGTAALYNCGVRANELCEDVFGNKASILEDSSSRERLVEICQRLRWMSVRELDGAFKQLPGFDPAQVPTEARDLGRPAEPIGGLATPGSGRWSNLVASPPKVVVFCLDWSASMRSRDTGTPLSRFETCMERMRRILREQIRDRDVVSLVVFGPTVQVILPLMQKGQAGAMLESRLGGLRPQAAGGTCFFDAVALCLQMLSQPGPPAPPEAKRWLVCLTDGDDLGSRPQNAQGQMVTSILATSPPANLSMVMITVGALKSINAQIIESWVERVRARSGMGRLLLEKDAASIAKAFDVVAEYLAAEVGGATEC
eukprot:TRINITY_DN25892_c0_g1_i2.p1 TRINITY_DN25892_c0_g1~~TRINITY_DN25892_c0_g1_i2.p1  ORF type:complete len:1704 (-),score=338.00 TRINITY_DN25892_c0_g1_i2:137-5248(-)